MTRVHASLPQASSARGLPGSVLCRGRLRLAEECAVQDVHGVLETCWGVKRPTGRKRLKRAEDEGQPEHRDAEEMRRDLFGNEGE
eukprot:1160261-Pelagomonas_calceolata.AAC.3